MQRIKICEGESWVLRRRGNTTTVFSEKAITNLPSEIATGFETADYVALTSAVGKFLRSGDYARVHDVNGSPGAVARVSGDAFSTTAINAALSHALALTDSGYAAPTYYGMMLHRYTRSASFMTRAPGVPLNEHPSYDRTRAPFQGMINRIVDAGGMALRAVGLPTDQIIWDPNDGNFFYDNLAGEPVVTVIDQRVNEIVDTLNWRAITPLAA